MVGTQNEENQAILLRSRKRIERVLCMLYMQGAAPDSHCRGGRVEGTEKANKGARGMPVALGGEEGRDKLRNAAVRGKCPVTRGCPNGETRRERSRHRTEVRGERGELKHLSTRRKRK